MPFRPLVQSAGTRVPEKMRALVEKLAEKNPFSASQPSNKMRKTGFLRGQLETSPKRISTSGPKRRYSSHPEQEVSGYCFNWSTPRVPDTTSKNQQSRTSINFNQCLCKSRCVVCARLELEPTKIAGFSARQSERAGELHWNA